MPPRKRITPKRRTKSRKKDVPPATDSSHPSPPSPISNPVPNPKVTIDHNFHPHIFDAILSYLDLDGLISVRGTCRHVRETADNRLAYHIVMARVDGKTVPTLPTNLKRRIPDRNFWRSPSTKDSVSVITIAPYKGFNSLHFPGSMAKLPRVEVLRNWGCKLDKWFPLPRVKTWIAWPSDSYNFPAVPKVVDERLVIITRGSRTRLWTRLLDPPLSHNVDVVVIMGHNWITDGTAEEHGMHYQDSPCNNAPCDEKLGFIMNLARGIVYHPARSGRPAFTLVGLDSHLAQHWPTDGGMPKGLIEDVSYALSDHPLMVGRPRPEEAERHIRFFTLDEYRNVVGEERFLLETTPPPRDNL